MFYLRYKPPKQEKVCSCEKKLHMVNESLFLIYTAGLSILYGLLQNIWQENSAAQSFYQTYYTDVLQHVLSVVTDTSHTAGIVHCTFYINQFTSGILYFFRSPVRDYFQWKFEENKF